MQYIVEGISDTLRMLPLLLLVLVIIETLEHRLSHRLQAGFSRLGAWGPVIGAGIGALPQCGGAIVASELYAARTLTLGTLLAVYLATSDEAVPVLATSPSKIAMIVPLVATKVLIGLLAGYSVDFLLARRSSVDPRCSAGGGSAQPGAAPELTANRNCEVEVHPSSGQAGVADYAVRAEGSTDAPNHSHAGRASDLGAGCPSMAVKFYEAHACLEESLGFPALLAHSLRRAIRIAFFLALTTAVLNWASEALASSHIIGAVLGRTGVQVFASAAFGLIPSCAPSVALTDLFVKGVLGYPALIAGLCANAGSGLVVLFHETNWRVVLRVVGILFVVSSASGFILSLFIR